MAKYYEPLIVGTSPQDFPESYEDQRTLELVLLSKAASSTGMCARFERIGVALAVNFMTLLSVADEVITHDCYIAVWRRLANITAYIVGGGSSNELILQSILLGLCDALQCLLKYDMEQRTVMQGFDLAMLSLDEAIDYGCVSRPCDWAMGATDSVPRILLETEPDCIAKRVSRLRTDPVDLALNEQTIYTAYQNMMDRMQLRTR